MMRSTPIRFATFGFLMLVLLPGGSPLGSLGSEGAFVFGGQSCATCAGLDDQFQQAKNAYQLDSGPDVYERYLEVYNQVARCRKDGCDTGASSAGNPTTSTTEDVMPKVLFTLLPNRVVVGDSVEVLGAQADANGDPFDHTWFINGTHFEELDGDAYFVIDEPPLGKHQIRVVREDSRGRRGEYTAVLTVVEQGDPVIESWKEGSSAGEDVLAEIVWEEGESPYESETTERAPARPCNEVYSSLEDAYQQYIALYQKLTKAATESGIWEPPELHEAQQAVFAANFKMESGDRRAYQEMVAAINRLNSLIAKVPIIDPPEMRELQEDYFQAKRCYEELLAAR